MRERATSSLFTEQVLEPSQESNVAYRVVSNSVTHQFFIIKSFVVISRPDPGAEY